MRYAALILAFLTLARCAGDGSGSSGDDPSGRAPADAMAGDAQPGEGSAPDAAVGDSVPGDAASGDAASGDAAGSGDSQQEPDAGPADSADPEEVVAPPLPVTVTRGPYFQWPRTTGFVVLAETAEELPLVVRVQWTGGQEDFQSVPVKPVNTLLGVPLEEFDGFLHEVEVTIPNTAAVVTVAFVNTVAPFETKLYPPAAQQELRMVMFGDTRSQDDKHQIVVDGAALEQPEVVVHTADMVSGGSILPLWYKFFQIEKNLLAGSFFFAEFGNHDILGESYWDTLFVTGNTFNNERNYWIDLGLVGLVVIDTYGTKWAGQKAQAWLEGALQQLQSKKWLIFSTHVPMYTFSKHGPWTEGRTLVQPLLEKYGVDLVFAGHNHCYEHFTVNGIPHIVAGGGGAPLYDTLPEQDVQFQYFVASDSFYHYVLVEADKDAMHVTAINAETNQVYETFDIE